MELSRTTASFTESVIREMTRICDSVGGINLSQGFPDFPTKDEIKNAAIKAIMENRNQYSVTYGNRILREAISRRAKAFNGIDADPENEITITCGATEAMISTMKAIINPGDEVVIFEPFYENYGPDTILSGAKPRHVTLYAPEWNFSYDELEAVFNKNTKAIILNTPNNPTGKVFSMDELEFIANLCKKYDAIAVSDEIYEHITYDGAKHISIATLPGMKDRTVTINSLSKTYSVTGWRVGWVIAQPRITKAVRAVHDFLTVGAPTPFQEAGAFAMSLPEEYYSQLRAHYNEARDYMYNTLVECGYKSFMPKGAYYFLADCRELMEKYSIKDDTEFSKFLIRETGVATVPGGSFYSDKSKGATQIRFCFCKSWDTLREASKRLKQIKL